MNFEEWWEEHAHDFINTFVLDPRIAVKEAAEAAWFGALKESQILKNQSKKGST